MGKVMCIFYAKREKTRLIGLLLRCRGVSFRDDFDIKKRSYEVYRRANGFPSCIYNIAYFHPRLFPADEHCKGKRISSYVKKEKNSGGIPVFSASKKL